MLIITGGIMMKAERAQAEMPDYDNAFETLGLVPEPVLLDFATLSHKHLDDNVIEEVETLLDDKVAVLSVSTSERRKIVDEEKLIIGDPKELDLLARIIQAEANGEPFEGKVAVGQVVLNRVKNDNFPDTIYEVIYQPRQFQPVMNGMIDKKANEESLKAAKEALAGKDKVSDALYFYNPEIAASQEWFNTLEFVKEIGNHVFRR